jgi:predicted cupin superfamily sugar epimerase
MSGDLTADDVRKLLQLEPNATCGFVRLTFVSQQAIAAGGLPAPFADGRPAGSALYFMVTPEAPVRLHRIRNDQLYHYYLGDPIELFLLHADGTSEHLVVGPDLRAGERVQQLIPGNTFHTARVIGRRRWFLGASTEWPGRSAGGRRNWRSRGACRTISADRRRAARHRRVGAALSLSRRRMEYAHRPDELIVIPRNVSHYNRLAVLPPPGNNVR